MSSVILLVDGVRRVGVVMADEEEDGGGGGDVDGGVVRAACVVVGVTQGVEERGVEARGVVAVGVDTSAVVVVDDDDDSSPVGAVRVMRVAGAVVAVVGWSERATRGRGTGRGAGVGVGVGVGVSGIVPASSVVLSSLSCSLTPGPCMTLVRGEQSSFLAFKTSSRSSSSMI